MLKVDIVQSKMKILKMASARNELADILREAQESNCNQIDFLDMVLEAEIIGREKKRIQTRIKQAEFPVKKILSDYNFSIRPGLNKQQIFSFYDGDFIDKKENLIFIGNSGTGKTHLSIAIGYGQCLKNKRVWFTTGAALINKLNEAKDEKMLSKFFKQAQKLDLVIIDEVGYFPYEKNESELLFQYISERYERGSLVITTNLQFSKWSEIFFTERLTTAILDRLIHHCHIIEIDGDSYRLNQSMKKKGKRKNN